MIPLVIVAALFVFEPPSAVNPLPGSDTSRTREATRIRQEALSPRQIPQEVRGDLLLKRETILDRMLSAEGDSTNPADSINALIRAHPELRELVLRELLMPDHIPGFSSGPPPSMNEIWRLAGNSPMTPFERMSLTKTRQMELHDRWTEGRILAPQADMIGTVLWMLGLFK